MKWILKLALKTISLKTLVSLLISALRNFITKKTKTTLDDQALDALEPILNNWCAYLENPTTASLKNNIQGTVISLLRFGAAATPFEWDDSFVELVIKEMGNSPAKKG